MKFLSNYMSRNDWTEEEQIIVLYYYFKGAKGYTNHHLVQELSRLIPRHSINSIAMKISNYTSLDTKKEGGLSHTSWLDRKVWKEYSGKKELLEDRAKSMLDSLE